MATMERPGFESGPIQVLPAGLLGLLQLKTPAGRNPQSLLGEVQPGIDMLPLYLNRQAIHAVQAGYTVGIGSGSGAFAFNSPSLIVPPDEWWYVHHMTVQTSALTAGDIFQGLCPAVFLDPNAPSARFHLFANPSYGAPTAGVGTRAAGAHDFYVPPGSSFAWFADTWTVAAGESVVADVFYSPMPV
jgi:hypothetical protein